MLKRHRRCAIRAWQITRCLPWAANPRWWQRSSISIAFRRQQEVGAEIVALDPGSPGCSRIERAGL